MSRYGKWQATEQQLGSGGQGTVYLAYNTDAFDQDKWSQELRECIGALGAKDMFPGKIPQFSMKLGDLLEKYSRRNQSAFVGALKVLHGMGPSADAEKATERMIREITTLRTVAHPNLLQILDADLERDQKWFVGEYHKQGSLAKFPDRFRGDMLASLKAFRPVVEGVAKLHEAHIVHRDIKPMNVFLATDNRLVLGDMGLVFFLDEGKTRVTETYENVGSRDWMPGWAFGMRLEDIRPSFDVFCLGKLFWFMLSGKTLLRLWYWQKSDFDVEKQFPADPGVKWARFLFERCIVEEEKDCLATAGNLLEEIDRILLAVSGNAQVIGKEVERLCLVCGLGKYRQKAEHDSAVRNLGLSGGGSPEVHTTPTFLVFECDHCGHVQLFSLPNGEDDPPPAWRAVPRYL